MLVQRIRQQWAGFLALFLVVTGGTAWALEQNSVGSKQIKPDAVRGSDLADNAVTSPNVVNGSLLETDFASGLDADTVDGKNAAQLASGRIHAAGSTSTGVIDRGSLLPGLSYGFGCSPGAFNATRVRFDLEDAAGTANAMMVATGVDAPLGEQDTFNVTDGAQIGGFPFSNGRVYVLMGNGSGDAAAETQLIIDVGSRTYSVALHMYSRASDGYCEATGTATLAE